MWEGVGDRTELQHIDPHSIGHQRFFPVLLGCSTGGLEAQPLWVLVFSTTSYLQLIWSLTDWISCALSYIIVQHPPSSCGRHKLHSFNPSTVNVIFWYFSTGCTCYLHRCISYFDSPTGSKVNMQQMCVPHNEMTLCHIWHGGGVDEYQALTETSLYLIVCLVVGLFSRLGSNPEFTAKILRSTYMPGQHLHRHSTIHV